MAILNGLAAIGLGVALAFALAEGPDRWAEGFYAAMIVLFSFELATFVTSLGRALRRDKTLGVLARLEFAVHVLLTVAAAVFAFTFRIELEP